MTIGIETHDVTKIYGTVPAIRDVNLAVAWGDSCTVFGPNGSGKSTLIRLLSSLTNTTSGHIKINNLDLAKNGYQLRRSVGVVTHQTFLYGGLTGYENLQFYGRMFSVSSLKDRIGTLVENLGIGNQIHHKVRALSQGMQKRISIARALLHDPSILLLDEPEASLDLQAQEILDAKLLEHRNNQGITIMTTHDLNRGLALGGQIVILAKGRIVYQEYSGNLDLHRFSETYDRAIGPA